MLAFGGNALLPDPGSDDDAGLTARVDEFVRAMLLLLPDHAGLVLVHGNGPQVGTAMLRVEATRDSLPWVPLDVLVAETQGSIGYLLSRAIRNRMVERGRDVEVATVTTQVVVAADDPAFAAPTKPVGPFYGTAEAKAVADDHGWQMVEVPGRGMRRVVPSPLPMEVVELHTIADAARHGHVVIAGGGGGIPVQRTGAGLHGVEAVIDKDRTAGIIARSLRAAGFVILTAVPCAYRGFGTDAQEPIAAVNVTEARRLLAGGEFPAGSMGPKIEAVCDYVEHTGRPGLITDAASLAAAIRGESGTWIGP